MVKPKRGLGKGLNALIPQSFEDTIKSEEQTDNGINIIDINLIKPNINQPRKHFDKEKIRNLEKSIESHGVVQPIIVRKTEQGYEIVAGERRWRAAKNVNLKELPCIVKNLNEEKLVEISLIENLQREDLNDIEEALAYRKLIDEYNLTQEGISEIVGKSRPNITNTLRLLNLSPHVQEMIIDGQISGGHGRSILRIDDEVLQRDVAIKIVNEQLTVRETEKLVANLTDKKNKPQKTKKYKDSNIVFIEESLKEVFGTKVNIINGKKKGKVEIEYYNDDDLERIIDLLRNK